jgi:hypothetical protein
VGLVARVLESAGITTAVHAFIPELAASVGAPRVLGIGYPGSVPFGAPGDADGQRAVLRTSLESAVEMDTPGSRIDLPFAWPGEARVPKPPTPPPIARAIMKRPWLYLKLLRGESP